MAVTIAGPLPLAVLMITRNEGHNIDAVANNLAAFASEIWIVDSFSTDDTVERALAHGMRVYQRKFSGFGDQWNFATGLPVAQPWTMKIDPDERLDDRLKQAIAEIIAADSADGFSVEVRLWFLGRELGVKMSQRLVRGWRSGRCRFTDIAVNEHALIDGRIVPAAGTVQHHDSPNLHHWLDKQNRYTTAEAATAFLETPLADEARLWGTPMQRRMWAKRNLQLLPLFPFAIFLYTLIASGAWKAGAAGLEWARLRGWVHRMIGLKYAEMRRRGFAYPVPGLVDGPPHPGATQVPGSAEATIWP